MTSQTDKNDYKRCINCEHIGKTCSGANFLNMEMSAISEWCRLRKEYLHTTDIKWTNAYIADQAQISKVSVDRLLSGSADDIKLSTAARIMDVLKCGTASAYTCDTFPISDDVSARLKRAEELETELEHLRRSTDYLKEQISFKDDQLVTKDQQLSERYEFIKRKDRTILALGIFLFITVAIIITALIVDRLNRNIGFFWTASYDVSNQAEQWLHLIL